MSRVIVDQNAEFLSNNVTDLHFGGNTLFNKNFLPETIDGFERAIEDLGIKGLRYPGGSIAETEFNIHNPETSLSGRDIFGLSEYIDWVGNRGADFSFVLPTSHLFLGEPYSKSGDRPFDLSEVNEMRRFLTDLFSGEFGNISGIMSAIEIGNEYWGEAQLTSKEYGRAVKLLVEMIGEIEGESNNFEAPRLLVQMGSPFSKEISGGYVKEILSEISDDLQQPGLRLTNGVLEDPKWMDKIAISNAIIINELADVSPSSIDGLVQHYYYDRNDIDDYSSRDFTYINEMYDQWSESGFKNKDLILTEWNVKNSNPEVQGLRSAGVLIDQFETMLFHGVDEAYAWPVQDNTKNDLGGPIGSLQSLTPSGAAFLLMSNLLPDLRMTTGTIDYGKIDSTLFSNEDRSVLILSSETTRKQNVNIDLDKFSGYTSATVYTVSVDPSSSDGYNWDWVTNEFVPVDVYLEHDTIGSILKEDVSLGGVMDLSIKLDAYEVAFVEFKSEITESINSNINKKVGWIFGSMNADSILGGNDSNKFAGLSGDDVILAGRGDDDLYGHYGIDHLYGMTGNDRIFCGFGDDVAKGNSGNDKIEGNSGNDDIAGGRGNDTLLGGKGDDLIYGNSGKDKLIGGDGDDKLHGGGGSDYISGKSGADTIFGGSGKDFLTGHQGDDLLYGGKGRDILDGGSNSDILIGGRGRDSLTGGNGDDTFVFNTGDSTVKTGRRDTIADFTDGDLIDLSGMDADTSSARDDAFLFGGTTATAHGVWYQADGSDLTVMGDMNGDGRADFSIQVENINSLSSNDFLL